MIKKWKLANFKSVNKKTVLEFEPLTIFAGANSSGKSTVIQSILLTAQTIQSPVMSRSVILNGHISKFGSYKDINSHNSKKKEIEIGFTLEPNYKDMSDYDSLISYRYFHFDRNIKNVELSYKFLSEQTPIEQLNPSLESVTIKSVYVDNKKTNISIKKSQKRSEERITDYEIKTISPSDTKNLEYEIEISPFHTTSYFYQIPKTSKIIGVNMLHFIPNNITILYNELDNQINTLKLALQGKSNRFNDGDQRSYDEIIYTTELKKIINDFFEDSMTETNINSSSMLEKRWINDLKQKVSTLRKNFNSDNLSKCLNSRFTLRYLMPQLILKKSEFDEILDKIDKKPYNSANSIPLHLAELDYIENQFKKNVKYLGPLRDEPKSIYPLEGYIDSMNLGFKGENTAAVLDLHKNREIKYVPSSEFTSSNEIKSIATTTLKEAVLDWLVYLGVASHFDTKDMGKLGHELVVSIDKSQNLHDLTHVGVGVSQVLPILVLSFLAGEDSTLIFEQPELHLHPKVQTRLADFFISQNILKKQCIVETHSEYLINRLRYLIAISKGDSLSKDAILYFVEKEGADSIYKEIRINKYGVIPEWPKGFFDESEKLASQLLEAGLKKRNKER
ncbi:MULTISPECIES: DUF3696 domain-containing protein [Sphingobacterium]|uniref:DUF3696 domain-containing protein n=1 Tax=Sphingobacterium TaxID=28453 RepID=UPI0010490713|nr:MULTISPECIES: DUF3696 domain-containing protein [Sphingobacterium]MCW2263746.1 putative ATPase [Sphingobacterium kitahiroshimense]TCR00625.1 uncharacterized protein DUF3696 [Sphingobacterium sp. JUb78]